MITLAEAQKMNPSAISRRLYDEIQVDNMLGILPFDDTAAISGRGGTTTYVHNRVKTGSGVSTRAIGGKYTASNMEIEQITITLAQLGGKFEIDRRIGLNIRPEREAQEMEAKVKAARGLFNKLVIHGDRAVDPNAFDGLSKALVGATRQEDTNEHDWTKPVMEAKDAYGILSALDDLNSSVSGSVSAYLGNSEALNKIRSAARLVNAYTTRVTPLSDQTEFYGSIALLDMAEVGGTDGDEEVLPIKEDGTAELFAVRFGLDAFHGVTSMGGNIFDIVRPDYNLAEEQVTGLVEIGPVGVALEQLRAAAVLRNVRLRPAA